MVQLHTIFHGMVISLDLTLSRGMIGCATVMAHLPLFQVRFELTVGHHQGLGHFSFTDFSIL